LAKNIALDEISTWRPNWDYLAWKKIYYGGFANKEVDDYYNDIKPINLWVSKVTFSSTMSK
jgi:hypothetical protein